jgi:hypothetical protein
MVGLRIRHPAMCATFGEVFLPECSFQIDQSFLMA